jgi:hypothetical protein
MNSLPKTIVIVGAGAVRGPIGEDSDSWSVIRNALNKEFGAFHPVSKGDENFVMANLVFKMRYLHLKKGSERFQTAQKEVIFEYNKFIQTIANGLMEAQERGDISLRPEFENLVAPYFNDPPVLMITTNWDTLLGERFAQKWMVEHLHGSVMALDLMLLPSEIVFENYRTSESINLLSKRHNFLLERLIHAERIVIYGLSLSPLDAELNMLIGESLRGNDPYSPKNNQSVVIIDKCPDTVEGRLRHFDPEMKITKIVVK